MTIGRTNSGSGGGISANAAVLEVTAPAGSSVTITNGSTSKSLDSNKSHVSSADSSLAVYVFSISQSQFGTWSITATRETESAESSITINAVALYEITISYILWLIKDGQFVAQASRAGGDYMTEQSGGYVQLHSSAASQTYATGYFSNIDVTAYNRIYFDGSVRGHYASGQCPAYGIISSVKSGANCSTFTASKVLLSATSTSLTTRGTTYLDISNISGEQTIGFTEAGSSYPTQGDVCCYNFYLSGS